jgi:hypothetical protein
MNVSRSSQALKIRLFALGQRHRHDRQRDSGASVRLDPLG